MVIVTNEQFHQEVASLENRNRYVMKDLKDVLKAQSYSDVVGKDG